MADNDLIGKTFGHLYVVEKSHKDKYGWHYWCKNIYSNERIDHPIRGGNLQQYHTRGLSNKGYELNNNYCNDYIPNNCDECSYRKHKELDEEIVELNLNFKEPIKFYCRYKDHEMSFPEGIPSEWVCEKWVN
jgi:hypothetical protein